MSQGVWTRAEIKNRAKNVLRKTYWYAFLVSLIIMFAGGNGGGGTNFSFRNPINAIKESGIDNSAAVAIFIGMLMFSFVIMIIFMLFRVFIGYTLEIGCRRYFLQLTKDENNLNTLGYGFKKGYYIEIIKAMIWRTLFNFLWFLALIIPGIIKSFAYSMVPYILSDNPQIGYKRALKLSEQMTYGHKWDLFVLGLSFMGWYFLGMLACCIGVIFVTPYFNVTQAQLYVVLRQEALNQGLCSHSELMLEEPVTI